MLLVCVAFPPLSLCRRKKCKGGMQWVCRLQHWGRLELPPRSRDASEGDGGAEGDFPSPMRVKAWGGLWESRVPCNHLLCLPLFCIFTRCSNQQGGDSQQHAAPLPHPGLGDAPCLPAPEEKGNPPKALQGRRRMGRKARLLPLQPQEAPGKLKLCMASTPRGQRLQNRDVSSPGTTFKLINTLRSSTVPSPPPLKP